MKRNTIMKGNTHTVGYFKHPKPVQVHSWKLSNVCVRVCMYVYKCIHTKTCTYMYVSTCVCAVYISVYIHIFFPEVLLAYMHTHLPFFSSFSSTRTKLTSTKATALWYFWRLSITAVAQHGYSSRHYKLAQISRYHTPLIPTTLLVS